MVSFLLVNAPATAFAGDREAALQVRQLTPELLDSYGLRGVSAIGGTGDWLLTNGTLCAVIADVDHPTYLSASGGVLIDLGYCGRDDDQWNTWHDMINLSQERIVPCQRLEHEVDERRASITCIGEQDGLERRWRYSLDLENPERLSMESRIRRIGEGPKPFAYGVLALHPYASLKPFSVNSRSSERNRGFRLPDIDTGNPFSIVSMLHGADLHVLMGEDRNGPPISYGLQLDEAYVRTADGGRDRVKSFSIRDPDFTMVAYVRAHWLADLTPRANLWDLAQAYQRSDLRRGETFVVRQSLYLSPRSDMRDHGDRVYSGERYRISLEGGPTTALVESAGGAPISWLRFERDETVSLTLPEDGDYRLRFDGSDSAIALATATRIEAPPDTRARLRLPDNGIMLLTFSGVDGTPDPVLVNDSAPLIVDEKRKYRGPATNQVALVPGHGSDSVRLAEGRYRVYASRGPEYAVNSRIIDLKASEEHRLELSPPGRVLEQPHWTSADFHVHTAYSFDSTLPAREQVMRFAAQGVDVLVATDHRRTLDLTPVVEQLGLQADVRALPGVELTSLARTERVPHTIGHANVFPVTPEPGAHLGGTLRHDDRHLGEVIADYRHHHPGSVFQLNHPRADDISGSIDENFFDHRGEGVGFDPSQPLSAAQNRHLLKERNGPGSHDLAFDAMEVLNGLSWEAHRRTRADWFALLRQGFRKTGTANSDSHATSQTVGLPRNYVKVGEAFDESSFVEAVRAGRLYGSTGPLLEVALGDAGIGDTFTGHEAVLRVTARTPDWFAVDTLRVFINGEQYRELAIAPNQAVEVPLSFDGNSFVVVEVQGPASEPYRAIYPGFYPFAFSNPIYVDSPGARSDD